MAEIKIAGILRAGAYSPNHIGNDAAIFNNVAEQLRKRGCEVNIYSEDQFISGAVGEEPVILNMCRDPRSVRLLQQREDAGALVINSGYGIENCMRERMTRILMGMGIPQPDCLIVNTDEGIRDALASARMTQCWIKRGDFHAMHKEDVTYVRHSEEAQEVLQEYFLRGIKRAVISRHLEGELVKFYGVVDTPFFFCLFPFRAGHAGATIPEGFDKNRLRAICDKAADALDIKVYGGDCIVGADGSLSIIDFNDWPSFAPCRNEAATHIAKYILGAVKKHLNR